MAKLFTTHSKINGIRLIIAMVVFHVIATAADTDGPSFFSQYGDSALRARLSALPPDEQEKRLNFYYDAVGTYAQDGWDQVAGVVAQSLGVNICKPTTYLAPPYTAAKINAWLFERREQIIKFGSDSAYSFYLPPDGSAFDNFVGDINKCMLKALSS